MAKGPGAFKRETRAWRPKHVGTPVMRAESDMMGMNTEILHYQTNEGFGAKAITVTIQNGRVVDKQWTQL